MTIGKTTALTIRTFVGKVMYLLLKTLSRFVTAFLPRSKCLLILWLQSPSAEILEPKKIKCHCLEHSQIHSMKLLSPWHQNQRHYKKKTKANIFEEYRHKNPPQNISKPNPTMYKKKYIPQPIRIYLRYESWFNILKSINVIFHINRLTWPHQQVKRKHLTKSNIYS